MNSINPVISYSETIFRFLNPLYKNKKDLTLTETALTSLNTFSNASELDTLQKKTLKECKDLVGRIEKQWFVSSKVKENIRKIEAFLDAARIHEKQHTIPFKILLKDALLRSFILVNHLHNKISQQHQAKGLGLYVDGQISLPLYVKPEGRENRDPHQGTLKRIAFKELKDHFKDNYNVTTQKIKDLEFLANGLEIHSAAKWTTLRPSYSLTEKNGKYVHIDTLTEKEETIGNIGEDCVQIVSANPWGWRFQGGSLFGHTWARPCY